MTARTEREGQPNREQVLSERLLQQVDNFLDQRRTVQEQHVSRNTKEHAYLRKTFGQILIERNRRAKDLASPEVQASIDIVNTLMPLTTYGISCMDSRVMRTIMYGLPLGPGGFVRVPAGDSQEFTYAQGGGLLLSEESYLATALTAAFKKEDSIVELLDSHLECAARNKKEFGHGTAREDNGLLEDVLRKKAMGAALRDHVGYYHPGKSLLPIQTSFNPENGFLYMGLEKNEAIQAAKKDEKGFTHAALDKLTEQGVILSTQKLLSTAHLSELFQSHIIEDFDWENNYRKTTAAFWQNMSSMIEGGMLNQIMGEVASVFPEATAKELRERSMLLAMNAYNAFHLNRDREYPHGVHKESCIVVSEGEHGPYGLHPSFAVFSKATADYGQNIELAASIIRENRKTGRVVDSTSLYTDDQEGFEKAPVPIIHKVVVREDVDWDQVRAMIARPDLLPSDWYKISESEFSDYLLEKGINPSTAVTKALNTLRKEMAIMYDPKGTKCVDGRYLPDQGTGMIARPGGDGGYVMALEGVNRMRNLGLTPEQCFNAVFNAVKKLNGAFYLHTDHNTDPNSKTHNGLIGCGHLAKAARRGFSWQYDVRSSDVKEMVNYARNLCEISDQVRMINLAGEHQEKGVFLIHSDKYTVSADNPKLHQMYFIYDVDRDRAFMKELVEEMNIPGLTVKDIQREADLQLDATLQNLALGLPMYDVTFEGRQPQVTYLGHITQKPFLKRFHVPFATPLFLRK